MGKINQPPKGRPNKNAPENARGKKQVRFMMEKRGRKRVIGVRTELYIEEGYIFQGGLLEEGGTQLGGACARVLWKKGRLNCHEKTALILRKKQEEERTDRKIAYRSACVQKKNKTQKTPKRVDRWSFRALHQGKRSLI